MATRILSFRYDAIHDRQWYERWFGAMAARRGLRLTTRCTQTRAVFGPNDVEAAVGELFNKAKVRELEKAGLIPLASDRVDKLCRPIAIDRHVYQDGSGSFKLTVETAQGNEFPCLGAWVYLGQELEFAGGFVTVECPAKPEIDAIADEVLGIGCRDRARGSCRRGGGQ